ncbi:DinB family protein [Paenibacillus andongensis]|uniref:DinB family protein n=1 Tax=Paenibacillus andongensis TaxID=2975482 RepID=UPI0021BB90CE|nr:DinB family protein [Paenibacillus andongensis]
MREDFVFQLFDKQQDAFLELVKKCPENKRIVVPEGFETNLHWHVGHVLTVTEFHVFGLSEQPLVLPENYQALFAYRTRTADWKEEPPAWDLLIAQLKEQRNLIHKSLKGKLEVPVKENFLKAENFGELIVSTTAHLATHIGVVSAMLQMLK